MTRETTVRLSQKEKEELDTVTEHIWGRHHDDVPYGAAVSCLCEMFFEEHAE